jgi:hypothetical protein
VKNKNVNDFMISDFTPQEINIFIMNRFCLFGAILRQTIMFSNFRGVGAPPLPTGSAPDYVIKFVSDQHTVHWN